MEEELLVEIVDRAKPVEYHCDVLANIYDPYHKTLQEYTEYLERLEVKHNIQKAMAKRDNQQGQNDNDESGGRKNRRRKHKNGGKRNSNASNNNPNQGSCELCGKPGDNKGHINTYVSVSIGSYSRRRCRSNCSLCHEETFEHNGTTCTSETWKNGFFGS
jgi:hypothetical protein